VNRTLVVGVPRSGTTWVSRVLSAPAGVALVHEPDNHYTQPYAFRVKRSLPGRFHPRLVPGDRAPAYERLWRSAFGLEPLGPRPRLTLNRIRRTTASRIFGHGQDRDQQHKALMRPGRIPPRQALAEALAVPEEPPPCSSLIVKSVYAALALEWITESCPAGVLVVLRGPYNVLSSWEGLWLRVSGTELLDQLDVETVTALAESAQLDPPRPHSSPLARSAFLYGLLTHELISALKRHPEWHSVWHESLAADPAGQFPRLAEGLGLPWTEESIRALAEMDRSGTGYETHRVTSETSDAWRERLTQSQIEEIDSVLAGRFTQPRHVD
jgi:Sulfotransferase family